MQKKRLIALLSVLGVCVTAPFVLAQDYLSQVEQTQSAVGFAQTDISVMIGGIISVVLSVLGVLLLIYIIYAGFLWMTAGGDKDQTKKAKDYMINAVIGLIITLSAYAISNFVISAIQSSM